LAAGNYKEKFVIPQSDAPGAMVHTTQSNDAAHTFVFELNTEGVRKLFSVPNAQELGEWLGTYSVCDMEYIY
jgi:hypothetical protein